MNTIHTCIELVSKVAFFLICRREIISLVEQPPRISLERLRTLLSGQESSSSSPTPSPSHSSPQSDEPRALEGQQQHSHSSAQHSVTTASSSGTLAAGVASSVQQQLGAEAMDTDSPSPSREHSLLPRQIVPSDGHRSSSDGSSAEHERFSLPGSSGSPLAFSSSATLDTVATSSALTPTESADSPNSSAPTSAKDPADHSIPMHDASSREEEPSATVESEHTRADITRE